MKEKLKIDTKDFSKLNVKGTDFYKTSSFNYPNSKLPATEKGRDYFKGWAEKIYGMCMNGKTWMSLSDYDLIDLMRAYADGRQPVQQYRDWILGSWGVKGTGEKTSDVNGEGWDVRNTTQPDDKRKAWANINTQAVSVSPKIFSKINEHIRSMYYEMSVNAIDSFSCETEELTKYRLLFEKENRKWLEAQYALVGIKMEEPAFEPKNLNELELYAATGGIKVPYSISMEDLIRHTFDVSEWDKEVAERIRKDLYSIGYSIVTEEFDREKERVVVTYSDPKFSGVQYSGKHSYKNSEFGYKMDWVEVSLIRQRLNMTHEEAASLAFAFSDQFGNPSKDDWGKHGYAMDEGGSATLGFDFYKIPVFYFEFIDLDNEDYIKVTNKYGRTVNKKYNGAIQDNEQLVEAQRRIVRQGKWIIGTEHLFDYGVKEYIPRDEYNNPRISFRAVRVGTIPIIEQIKPFVDGFNLAWIKLQDFIAKAVGNGFAIDVGSLKDISVGKDKSFDPLEALNYYRQSTFLLYKRAKTGLSGMAKVNAPPVIPIANNTYDNIRAQFESMNFFMEKIEHVTGLSMVATGKSPDPNVAKFNTQVALQGTNEIIGNLARCQTDLQEDVSVNVCYRIRSLCRVNEHIRKSYEEVIGEQRMKAVIMAEKNHVKYGIRIEASDISEEKQTILAYVGAAIKAPGSDELGKLDISEAIIIQDMIMQRQNFRRIGLIIGYMLRKKEQQAQAIKERNMEIQGQQIMQPEIMKQEAKQAENAFELQKMDKQFYYDYFVKWGVPPGQTPIAGNKGEN